MHHRGTYIRPDTPKGRPSPGRVGAVIGAVVGIGALAGVSSVVAQASPGGDRTRPAAASASPGALPVAPDVTVTVTVNGTQDGRAWRRTWLLRTGDRTAAPGTGATSASPVDPTATPTGSATPTEAPASNATSAAVATGTPSASSAPTSSAPTTSASTTSAPPAATDPGTGTAGTAARLFSAASPWNTPIAAGAATDPASDQVVAQVLNNRSLVVNLNMYAFGIPFYTAAANTPRVTLKGATDLGPVPLDPSWRPNDGADHKMNVIDPSTGTVYELQGFDPGARSVYWAVKKDYRTSLADGYPQDGKAGPTGSGLTQSGGVVRLAEMASGRIDHALSFITSRPVNRFRYPASHSDGNIGGIGLEEGMRVQLDPSLNVDAIPGITPGEKVIAKALQRYGAYCTDTGGGNNQAMGIYVEKPKAGDRDPYPAAGFPQDWAQLPHIPRDKLRVLAVSATPRP